MADELNLSNLHPASARTDRKRVGRGQGSGKGRYSGRGIKGQKARSGSKKMRAGFEGGQMPLYMRIPKQRGATSKDAMPVGPHRTFTQSVNVSQLEERFDAGAEITPEALKKARLIKNLRVDVKILGNGELTKSFDVTVHRLSASAREKIEAAGGTFTALRDLDQKPRKGKKRKKAAAPAEPEAAAAPEASEAQDAAAEPEPEAAETQEEEA
jgi:large subunit ribosomal protein L15